MVLETLEGGKVRKGRRGDDRGASAEDADKDIGHNEDQGHDSGADQFRPNKGAGKQGDKADERQLRPVIDVRHLCNRSDENEDRQRTYPDRRALEAHCHSRIAESFAWRNT